LIEANGDSVQGRLANAVHQSQIQSKDRVWYLVDSDTAYTGWTKNYYKGFLTLKQWSNGRGDGPEMTWHSNGQKLSETDCKHGKLEGRFTMWHKDGWKSQEGMYKDGNWDGTETKWYANGQKKSETTYKDGKPVSKPTQWDENGELISQ
jgi:antitoxin component YwqK of YwqJK toxin-antitoxin module